MPFLTWTWTTYSINWANLTKWMCQVNAESALDCLPINPCMSHDLITYLACTQSCYSLHHYLSSGFGIPLCHAFADLVLFLSFVALPCNHSLYDLLFLCCIHCFFCCTSHNKSQHMHLLSLQIYDRRVFPSYHTFVQWEFGGKTFNWYNFYKKFRSLHDRSVARYKQAESAIFFFLSSQAHTDDQNILEKKWSSHFILFSSQNLVCMVVK